MAEEVLFLVEDAVEGGYIARALGYSIFAEADPCSATLTRRIYRT